MKKLLSHPFKFYFLILCLLQTAPTATAQNNEGLGMPGDNLNLSAVLDVFQQSKTLEAFEAALNSNNFKINNLDLNNDGKVDYIKVQDYQDGNLHSIILQTDINNSELQDLAVIYVDKQNNGNVDIQIVGDEDLYGKNYVIDIDDEEGTPNPGYQGNTGYDDNDYNSYSPASNWGIIMYMYTPSYNPWFSPWHWGYYPSNWYGWSPFFWNDYYYHCYHVYNWYWPHYYFSNRNRFRRHHANWYGRNRRRSNTYQSNHQNGIYEKSYQGKEPARRPEVGDRISILPEKRNQNTIENNTQPKPDFNNNRKQTIERNQPDIRRNQDAPQQASPRQEMQRETPKPVQPIRQAEPRQTRPVERPAQPAYTPPPRQEPRQAPAPPPAAQPVQRGQPERRR